MSQRDPPLLTKANVEKYLTNLTTAAEMLGCSRQAVAQYIERGDLSVWCPGSVRLVQVEEVVELAARLRIPGRKPMKPEHVKRRIERVNEKRRLSQQAIDHALHLYKLRNGEIHALSVRYAARIKKAGTYEEKTVLRQERNRKIRQLRGDYSQKIKEARGKQRTAMRRKK